jgi:transcriptional regulator with XRE-family HTH domain
MSLKPDQLVSVRRVAGLTQHLAAARLGVSQAYLAMLERGRRPVTAELALRIGHVYGLGPIALPLSIEGIDDWDSAQLASTVGALGYPGFRQFAGGSAVNPAVLLLTGICSGNLEVRVVEAFPWILVEYHNLDWEWLIREAKLRDVQNRLGFLVSLGRRIAIQRGNVAVEQRLAQIEEKLDRSRLVREDTLCQLSISEPEREWLRRHRSEVAMHWNLMTDLDARVLPYAA